VTPNAKTARLAAAIENNVDWCERVCKVNGLSPQRTATAWTSAVRTPKLYPDAISLSVDTTADEILEVIDLSEGCSVKDSFATLDLHPYGFSILLEDSWFYFSAANLGDGNVDPLPAQGGVKSEPIWETVTTPANLAEWVTAWQQSNDSDALHPNLLNDPTLDLIWARSSNQVLAGAIVNRSENANGLSNYFSLSLNDVQIWRSCVTHVCANTPGLAVVGYVTESNLSLMKEAKFAALGPLRIWIKSPQH
jgi:hypothetical protein